MAITVTLCEECENPICRHCETCNHVRNSRSGGTKQHYRCSKCVDGDSGQTMYHCKKDPKRPQCKTCEACEKKCECMDCPNCNKRYKTKSIIKNGKCRSCDENLKRSWCEGHGAYSTGGCEFCTRADCCCGCPPIMDRRADIKFYGSSTFEINPSRRFMALELEAFGYQDQKHRKDKSIPHPNVVMKKWNMGAHHDGSIRGENEKEITTSPANGDLLFAQTNEIVSAVKNCGAKSNEESGCGLHVHVNVEDLSVEEIQKVALIYATVEDQLYRIWCKGRDTNNYCSPNGPGLKEVCLSENYENVQTMSDAAYNALRNSGKGSDRGKRYHGFNLEAHQEHHTIEFRMMGGTLDMKKILSWLGIIGDLFDFALGLKLEEAKAVAMACDDSLSLLKMMIRKEHVLKFVDSASK